MLTFKELALFLHVLFALSTLKPFGTSFLPFLVGLAFFYLITCVWWFEEGYPQNLPSGIPSIGSLAFA